MPEENNRRYKLLDPVTILEHLKVDALEEDGKKIDHYIALFQNLPPNPVNGIYQYEEGLFRQMLEAEQYMAQGKYPISLIISQIYGLGECVKRFGYVYESAVVDIFEKVFNNQTRDRDFKFRDGNKLFVILPTAGMPELGAKSNTHLIARRLCQTLSKSLHDLTDVYRHVYEGRKDTKLEELPNPPQLNFVHSQYNSELDNDILGEALRTLGTTHRRGLIIDTRLQTLQ